MDAHATSHQRLTATLRPLSIAVVGASPRSFAGQVVQQNCAAHRYRGVVVPVNGKYDEIAGIPTVASLRDLDAAPDAVVALVGTSRVQGIAEEAGLKLTHESHGHLPAVKADTTTVKQILFNLLTNAIAFSPSEGVIEIAVIHGHDGKTRIEVADRGPGVSPGDVESLFLPLEVSGVFGCGVWVGSGSVIGPRGHALTVSRG